MTLFTQAMMWPSETRTHPRRLCRHKSYMQIDTIIMTVRNAGVDAKRVLEFLTTMAQCQLGPALTMLSSRLQAAACWSEAMYSTART